MSYVGFAREIRVEALKMVTRARASHIGGALSMADILAVLYAPGGLLRFDPADLEASDRDRLILSKGHACTSLYAALALRGAFPLEELEAYGTPTTRLMSHASHKVPGVEWSTGSLGHGLPVGCGMALGGRMQGQSFRTVVILSDGEMDEGSNWEAILFAAQHRLDNLVAVVDLNGLQGLGRKPEVLNLEPLADKFQAFGWRVLEGDGHDLAFLPEAFQTALGRPEGQPTVLLTRTVKGKGVPFMEDQMLWHYKSPDEAQLKAALEALEGEGSR